MTSRTVALILVGLAAGSGSVLPAFRDEVAARGRGGSVSLPAGTVVIDTPLPAPAWAPAQRARNRHAFTLHHDSVFGIRGHHLALQAAVQNGLVNLADEDRHARVLIDFRQHPAAGRQPVTTRPQATRCPGQRRFGFHHHARLHRQQLPHLVWLNLQQARQIHHHHAVPHLPPAPDLAGDDPFANLNQDVAWERQSVASTQPPHQHTAGERRAWSRLNGHARCPVGVASLRDRR